MTDTVVPKSVSEILRKQNSQHDYVTMNEELILTTHLQRYRFKWCIFNLNMRCSIFKF